MRYIQTLTFSDSRVNLLIVGGMFHCVCDYTERSLVPNDLGVTLVVSNELLDSQQWLSRFRDIAVFVC